MVTGHMDSLKEIFQNHSASKQQQQEFNELMQDKNAKLYYQNIIAGLGAMYAAAQAVDSGYIDPDKQGGLGLIGKILDTLSESVPVLSSVGKFAGGVLEHIDKGIQKDKMSNITKLAATNQIMNKIASGVAIALVKEERYKKSDSSTDLNLIIKNILEGKILQDQLYPDQQLVVSELTSIITKQSADLNIPSAIQALPGNVVANSAMAAASGNNNAVDMQQVMARISQLEQHNQELQKHANKTAEELRAALKTLEQAVNPTSKSVGSSGQMQLYLNRSDKKKQGGDSVLKHEINNLKARVNDNSAKVGAVDARLEEVDDYSRTNRDLIKQNQRGTRTIMH